MTPVLHLASTDSTNQEMMRRLRKGPLADGTIILADFQTQGRGRLKRSWESRPGSSMLCSFWCELAVRGTALTGFSLVPPLAVTDCLHELSVDALCKWPNDVRWRGRKLCGILTQCLTGRDIVLGAVVGVGLNIKDAPDLPGSSSAPVCLQEILGFAPDVETLATAIGSCLMERKKRWLAGERAAQLNEWLEQCDHKETEVRVTIGGQRVSGIMRGLGPQGQLLFEHDGRVDEVWADDIVPLA